MEKQKSKLNHSALKEFRKSFTKNFIRGFSALNLEVPYTVPTFIRKLSKNEYFPDLEEESLATQHGRDLGLNLGAFTIVPLCFPHYHAYRYAIDSGHPEVLAFPIATNVASFFYEVGIKPLINKIKDKMGYLEAELDKPTLQIDY